MEEIWKDVVGYEGLYQVSNKGRVKSLSRHREVGWANYISKERIIKPATHRQGYKYVCLHKNGNKKIFKIHRLVAIAFIPNPNGFNCINHKDENPSNNNLENLEWCNHSYNNRYGMRCEKFRKSMGKVVLQFTKNGDFLKEWICMRVAQRETGIRNIDVVCRGERKTAGGYIWKYKEVK